MASYEFHLDRDEGPLASDPSAIRHSTFALQPSAFTIVELLVVVVIIVILITAIVAASTTFINNARVKNTQAVLQIVRQAVEDFGREQAAKPTLVKQVQGTASYRQRYGVFPPDELELFTPKGLPGSSTTTAVSLAIGGATAVPEADYAAMRFYTNGDPAADAAEHRDIAALVLAMEMYSPAGWETLNHLPTRNWSAGAVDMDGFPSQFLDRDMDGDWDADGDGQIRYILDDWGIPITYLAQRDWLAAPPPPGVPPPVSRNHAQWNQSSTEMIRLNSGQPIIASYGPDGKNQLTEEWMGGTGKATLVADWADAPGLNHPLNQDNVYADPTLSEKLAPP